MATITIKNVGPVKNVENLEFNKVNIFMGPQCSGKSTICKVASYCSWVEKRICLTQSFAFFEKENNFFNILEVFHKLKGYFRSESSIEYESDSIKFKYEHSKRQPHFEWKNRYDYYRRSKISYIPSERNLPSVIENLLQIKFKENNILDFVIDWTDAKKVYTKESPLSILKLGVQYYYDQISDRDIVVVDEKGTTLDLTNTSSGLQSIIPLEVVTKYLTTHIYEKNNVTKSESDVQIAYSIKEKIYNDLFKEKNQNIVFPPEGGSMKIYVDSSGPWSIGGVPSAPIVVNEKEELQKNHWLRIFISEEEQKKFIDKTNCFIDTQYTQLIIEEPEQNLFPSTQRDLVYHLIQLINGGRDHRLTLSTHSPYILYALNNCMMGHLVSSQLSGEEKSEYLTNEFLSKQSWIDPKLVSVWEIEDGELRSIQDKDNIIVKNYFGQIMTELTDEYYQMLNFYKNEE